MWIQQRMMMATPSADPKQQQQARMMQWMMPIMFGWITLFLPSGLGLFWVTSSVIRIAAQYFTTGQSGLTPAKAPRQAGGDKKYKGRITQEEKGRLK